MERNQTMNDNWIHQTRLFGLGNFINLTPTIKLMSDHFGERIPVYFDLDFIKQCFLDCPFIEILDKEPDSTPLFTSGLINYKNDCPDYIHVYREVSKRIPFLGELPHTYVDKAHEIPTEQKDYTLFIRGSGSEDPIYVARNSPDDNYYYEYLNENLVGNYLQIFTGSQNDLDRSKGLFKDMPCIVGDIRKSLALIRDASFIVANDTGLAHAAGAMNKNMVVLWKNNSLPKSANPGKRTMYKMCH